jgi:hypothetical protein
LYVLGFIANNIFLFFFFSTFSTSTVSSVMPPPYQKEVGRGSGNGRRTKWRFQKTPFFKATA